MYHGEKKEAASAVPHQHYYANREQMLSSRFGGITHGTASSRSTLLLVAYFEGYVFLQGLLPHLT